MLYVAYAKNPEDCVDHARYMFQYVDIKRHLSGILQMSRDFLLSFNEKIRKNYFNYFDHEKVTLRNYPQS